MTTLTADSEMDRTATQLGRIVAHFAAWAAATGGYALARSINNARTSDAFLIWPNAGQVLSYLLILILLAGLALVFELGAPPAVAHGGRAARTFRAAIRRRFRHGRSRAEIANVEVGLTISFSAVLLAFAFSFATLKLLLVVLIGFAIIANLSAISSLCRLVGHAPGWSALIGFVYGLVAGYVLG